MKILEKPLGSIYVAKSGGILIIKMGEQTGFVGMNKLYRLMKGYKGWAAVLPLSHLNINEDEIYPPEIIKKLKRLHSEKNKLKERWFKKFINDEEFDKLENDISARVEQIKNEYLHEKNK